jgi:hypothetical protein
MRKVRKPKVKRGQLSLDQAILLIKVIGGLETSAFIMDKRERDEYNEHRDTLAYSKGYLGSAIAEAIDSAGGMAGAW